MRVLGIFVILMVFGGAMFILLKNYTSNMTVEEDDEKRKAEEERLKAMPPRCHMKAADMVKIADQEMTLGRQIDMTFYHEYKEHHLKVILDNSKLIYMVDNDVFTSVNDMVNRCLVDGKRFFSINEPMSLTNFAYQNEASHPFVGDERFAKFIVYGDNKEYDKQVKPGDWD